MEFCYKIKPTRSQYDDSINHRCYREKEHSGACEEFPYLSHLQREYPRVANKIKRDATKTTGAPWKSKDAGPNRISRWVMLLSDEELLEKYGLSMQMLKPHVRDKLREKAATYESCMEVAMWLTWLVYQMDDAPQPPQEIEMYLTSVFGEFQPSSTKCIICLDVLSFDLFRLARRGKAAIETAHKDPRTHNTENVGFAHRECNIAQGNKTLDDFYTWISDILEQVN